MQELEKILEEIDQTINRYGKNPELITEDITDFCYGLNVAKGIIRKHMNDGERFELDFSNVKSFDCQCGRHYVNTGIEEIQQYREIGTVEECREAVEKQTPVSRIIIEGQYFCPKCKNLMRYPGYCGCGQRVY